MSEPHDIRGRLAFSDRGIVGRNWPYGKWLQPGPNSWLVETGVTGTPFVGGEPWPHFFFTISRASPVALFRGSDSGSTNGAFFSARQLVRKIIASEALNSAPAFRSPQFKPHSGASDLLRRKASILPVAQRTPTRRSLRALLPRFYPLRTYLLGVNGA